MRRMISVTAQILSKMVRKMIKNIRISLVAKPTQLQQYKSVSWHFSATPQLFLLDCKASGFNIKQGWKSSSCE